MEKRKTPSRRAERGARADRADRAGGYRSGGGDRQAADDGVELFAGSFRSLMDSIAAKSERSFPGGSAHRRTWRLREPVDARMEALSRDGVMSRIRRRDNTVWSEKPDGIADRLGWLSLPDAILESADGMEQFARDIVSAGYTHALLPGWAGPLWPLNDARRGFRSPRGVFDLAVIDTTDPGSWRRCAEGSIRKRPCLSCPPSPEPPWRPSLSSNTSTTVESDALGKDRAGGHFIAVPIPARRWWKRPAVRLQEYLPRRSRSWRQVFGPLSFRASCRRP